MGFNPPPPPHLPKEVESHFPLLTLFTSTDRRAVGENVYLALGCVVSALGFKGIGFYSRANGIRVSGFGLGVLIKVSGA